MLSGQLRLRFTINSLPTISLKKTLFTMMVGIVFENGLKIFSHCVRWCNILNYFLTPWVNSRQKGIRNKRFKFRQFVQFYRKIASIVEIIKFPKKLQKAFIELIIECWLFRTEQKNKLVAAYHGATEASP